MSIQQNINKHILEPGIISAVDIQESTEKSERQAGPRQSVKSECSRVETLCGVNVNVAEM